MLGKRSWTVCIVFWYSQIYRIELGSHEGLDGQFWIITKPARNGNENWFERKLAITNSKNSEQICSCFAFGICSIVQFRQKNWPYDMAITFNQLQKLITQLCSFHISFPLDRHFSQSMPLSCLIHKNQAAPCQANKGRSHCCHQKVTKLMILSNLSMGSSPTIKGQMLVIMMI